ncbi:MAG: hypothetical protein ABI690_13650 [Chloroflexota bacterium]
MIANHESKQRFDTISDMAADIADLKQQLAEMTAQRDTLQTRAVKAQTQVRQLEAQLISPAREVKTLYSHIARVADQEKFDKELSAMTSAGWTLFDSGVIPGTEPARFVSLIRTVPISAEPDQPAAAVVANPAAPAPTVKESPTVDDPAPAPAALAVTRKTVTATSILIDPSPDPADKRLLVKTDPALDGDAEFQADLANALQQKAEEIRRTNPLLNLPHRSFGVPSGAYVS